MKTIQGFAAVFLAFCFVFLSPDGKMKAENIRKPVWAGRFYPAEREALAKMLDQLTRQAKKTPIRIPAHKFLRALIMPHAGYIYSGLTAAHVSHVLEKNKFDKVVLLGPDHRVGFSNGAVSDADAFQTPFGLIQLHADVVRLRKESDLFQSVPDADRNEHSLEVILPFLQTYMGDFELVPIVLGPGNVDRLASVIDTVVDKKTLVVVSSDLSHFLPYEKAVSTDQDTIRMILNFESEKLIKKRESACGRIPILVLLNLARKNNWQPVLLHYSNSGDTAGDRRQVVGYAAIAFFGDASASADSTLQGRLSPAQARTLIRLARVSIMKKLDQKVSQADLSALSDALKDDIFKTRCGVFVTLTIDKRLRGCIGNLAPTESMVDGVRRNALNAAFRDPRFPPLAGDELDRTDIEISILTVPQSLAYNDPNDLVRKLRADIDGVIIQKGSARATYLPLVWKQIPQKEAFLSHLCRKAGLPADAWKKEKLNIQTYQVHYYDEEK